MSLTAMILSTAILAAPRQDASMYAPPAEMKQVEFMVGNWKSEGSGMGMDGQESKIKGSAVAKMAVGGRYLEWVTDDEMDGFGKMQGEFKLTYNTMISKWEGVWFDSMSPYSMRAYGTLKDGVLDMMSEEVDMPEMGKTKFNIVYKKISDKKVDLVVSLVMGEQKIPAVTHHYTKN
ncbi:MAG: DUF1579 family protein [Armatimonadetes bacterium]|nr:DUF1579 family protein [Armatimonadota bacterium]